MVWNILFEFMFTIWKKIFGTIFSDVVKKNNQKTLEISDETRDDLIALASGKVLIGDVTSMCWQHEFWMLLIGEFGWWRRIGIFVNLIGISLPLKYPKTFQEWLYLICCIWSPAELCCNAFLAWLFWVNIMGGPAMACCHAISASWIMQLYI